MSEFVKRSLLVSRAYYQLMLLIVFSETDIGPNILNWPDPTNALNV